MQASQRLPDRTAFQIIVPFLTGWHVPTIIYFDVLTTDLGIFRYVGRVPGADELLAYHQAIFAAFSFARVWRSRHLL